MFFVCKEDIENYRYAIAKVCFLKLYSDYILLEDVSKSNCMKMQLRSTKEKVVVSLFKTPPQKLSGNKTVSFYSPGSAYNNAKQKKEGKDVTILRFSNEFIKEYTEAFREAFNSPERYYNNIGEYGYLFENILLKHDDVNGHNRKWYKYYSDEKVLKNRYGVVDGAISFADPNTFNDPFDVNCFFANSKDMSGLFRIFCVAPSPTEILMWSYYSSDHKGYCFEYNEKEILERIIAANIDGLCIIGDVKYTRTRPKQKSKLNAISFSEINFYVQAAFTKFEEWNHEKEYRYVILSSSFGTSNQYYTVTIPVYNIFSGLKAVGTPITNTAGVSITPQQVSKHPSDYKLI